jgi:dihydropteroate synthase
MFKIPARDRYWEIDQPQIMGIINATADSFYEESRIKTTDLVLEKVRQFIQEGASVIDLGAQSTRPGAKLVTAQEEMDNLLPLVEAISDQFPSLYISIDTFHSQVALAALNAGAHIINDISTGAYDPNMFKIIADQHAGYIGMHLTGNFENMHQIPTNRVDIIETIFEYFIQKKKELANVGVYNWVVDPGFGFGKSIQENFTIVKCLSSFKALNLPILLGASRKSSIYKTLQITPQEALNGTTVVNTVGILNGASVLRVHDVKEAKESLTLLSMLK